MDLNYDIQTWDFSLQAMTLTKTTHQIVEAARSSPTFTVDPQIIAERAISEVEMLELHLLPSMVVQIKTMIKPIMTEVLEWYRVYGYRVQPILTPHGTVDAAKSARALINHTGQSEILEWYRVYGYRYVEYGYRVQPILTPHGTVDPAKSVRALINPTGQSVSSSFEIACVHCLEEDIFKYGSQLTQEERLMCKTYNYYFQPLPDFWYTIYKGRFEKIKTLEDLSVSKCTEGFQRAVHSKKLVAMEYFSKKLSQKRVHAIVDFYKLVHQVKNPLLPTVCARLFKIDQRDSLKGMFSTAMLIALLNWPYQHLFLEASKSLVENLSVEQYWQVAMKIIKKARKGYGDHNYKGLFVGFWKMGSGHINDLQLRSEFIYSLLRYVFIMLDKDIALMVFDAMYERNKDYFYGSFIGRCAKMIYAKKYEALLLALNVCKARNDELYLKFKKFFMKDSTRGIAGSIYILTGNYSPHDCREKLKKEEKWRKRLKSFLRVMSERETAENP